jgi:hypothetical protein
VTLDSNERIISFSSANQFLLSRAIWVAVSGRDETSCVRAFAGGLLRPAFFVLLEAIGADLGKILGNSIRAILPDPACSNHRSLPVASTPQLA